MFLDARVEVLRLNCLVELAQQPAVDLQLGPVRRWHDDVVSAAAGHQLGMDDLVVVEIVVADLDAGFLLEVAQRVFGDVVRPVVDVEDFLLLLAATRGNAGGQTQGRANDGVATA
jgi:hypothetical protein